MAPNRRTEIIEDVFGTPLQQQGRGFYVALELLAICRGALDAGEPLLKPDGTITYLQRSHDVARRLATGEKLGKEELNAAVDSPETEETLRALFSSLVVGIPGRRTAPRWYAAHLYPFVGELVHYDAVERRERPQIERYTFRDAGGFAYRVLRTDPDHDRRARNADALARLVGDSETPLGRIAAALGSHDLARSHQPFVDKSEAKTRTFEDQSPWPDLLRRGCDRILQRKNTPAKRVEQLFHFVPYSVARHQLRLARVRLGLDLESIPVDAASQPNSIRNLSQAALNEFRWNIVNALADAARQAQQESANPHDRSWDQLTESNPKFAASPRAFFTETLAAVGALNATAGRRHFTFKVPMLEALVAATVDPGEVVEFEEYCALLYSEMALVVSGDSARVEGMTEEVDEAEFRTNRDHFRQRLDAGGLLTRYSDATDLVHGELR